MDQHRLDEAAKRVAAYAHKQYGNWYMGSTEDPSTSDRWPDFLDLIVRYTTQTRPMRDLLEDRLSSPWYTEGLFETVECPIDAYMSQNSFEDDAATTPRGPTTSPGSQSPPSPPSPTDRPSPVSLGVDMEGQTSQTLVEPDLLTTSQRPSAYATRTSGMAVLSDSSELSASRRGRHNDCISVSYAADAAKNSKKNLLHIPRPRKKRRVAVGQGLSAISSSTINLCSPSSEEHDSRDDLSKHYRRIRDFVEGIGNEATLLRLRSTLEDAHHSTDPYPNIPRDRTAAEIFHAMDGRDEIIQFQILQQGLDAMELYEHLRHESSGQSSERFHVLTNETFERSMSPRDGNPLSLDKADIVARLVREIVPSLDEKSLEYKKIYAKAKEFRKCGSRLALISEKFGKGIIPIVLLSGEGEQRITHWKRHMSVVILYAFSCLRLTVLSVFVTSQSDFSAMFNRIDVACGNQLRRLSDKLHAALAIIQCPASSERSIPLQYVQFEDMRSMGGKERMLDQL